MAEHDWKGKVGRVPLIGRLLAMVRGCWTLPVWRQALRDQAGDLHHELALLRDRLDSTEARLEQARQELGLDSPLVRALWAETDARVTAMEWQCQRMADAGLRSREASRSQWQVMADDLLALRRGLAALSSGQALTDQCTVFPGEATGSSGQGPWPAMTALPVAEDVLERWRQPLAAKFAALRPGAPWCDLSAHPPAEWAGILNDLPPDSQAAIVAVEGASAFTPAQQGLLLAQAVRRLRPGGWLALGFPNPENLEMLLQQTTQAAPGWQAPAQVQARFASAGLADLALWRTDAPLDTEMPERWPELPAGAGERLAWAWSRPRRYLIAGHRPLS